jgi:transposase-like protein
VASTSGRGVSLSTEKPGVSVAQAYRPHGIVTSLLFCGRVQFGVTARKAPQPATVSLLALPQRADIVSRAFMPALCQKRK